MARAYSWSFYSAISFILASCSACWVISAVWVARELELSEADVIVGLTDAFGVAVTGFYVVANGAGVEATLTLIGAAGSASFVDSALFDCLMWVF